MNELIDPVAVTTPVRTTPVAAETRPPRRASGRVRWLVALVASVLVLGLAGGATLLLTTAAGDAAVLAWVPADAATYAELRLDLPGSQRTELPKLLSALPGFADQAAFPAKLGEALDRLVRSATGGKHDYQTEIAPWFGGQLAVATGPVTLPASGASASAALASARILALAQTTDPAKATAWLSGLLAEAGATTTTESYSGVTVTLVHPPAASGSGSGASPVAVPDGAYAVLGQVLVMGDTTSVHASIDTRGSRGLGTLATYRTAASSVTGDHVAFFWADTKALMAPAVAAAKGATTDTMATALIGLVGDSAPAWTAGVVRAADGNLVLDTVEPQAGASASSGSGASSAVHASRLAALVPADTIALMDAHDRGAAIAALRTRLAADPALAPAVTQIDQALGILGGLDAVTGWIGDAGIAVTQNGGTVAGGLVIAPADLAGGTRLLKQLRSFAELAGAAANVVPTFTDETYGDAVVTTVTVSDAGNLLKLLQGAAGGAGLPNLPAVPSLGALPAINLSFAYATTPQVVVFGTDAAFVKAVLDARAGPSLASQPRFSSLLAKAGANGTGLAWIDVAAVRDLVAAALPADARATYDTDIKPYVAPLDALVASSTIDGALVRSTIILSIKP